MPSYSRYRPILPTNLRDAELEMEAAFESENDDDTGSMHSSDHSNRNDDDEPTAACGQRRLTLNTIPGSYNFEREYEYDYPPPGSPPGPSASALPNNFGNSNGVLPSSPVRPSIPRPSFLRRIAGLVLPTHYIRIPSEVDASRTVGGGTENDGVFANVMAKPQRQRTVQTENGDVHIMPEEIQRDAPPSYTEAQADAVPPYWETTIHAPAGIASGADMIIDNLPIGSTLIFCLNAFISFFFQFVGFLLTYLLHTSHAAKHGSRAGLGLTLIQFGFYTHSVNSDGSQDNNAGRTDSFGTGNLSSSGFNITSDSMSINPSAPNDGILLKDWLSFFFMALGWFIILSSFFGFWRVKRWEYALRNPAPPPSPEAAEHFRRDLEGIFGICVNEDDLVHPRGISNAEAAAEARLTRDLRAAGLL